MLLSFVLGHAVPCNYSIEELEEKGNGKKQWDKEVKRVEGYYRKDCSETDNRYPSGRLSIEVINLPEFYDLVRQAKKEAAQLNQTIGQLENFELNITFSAGEDTSSES